MTNFSIIIPHKNTPDLLRECLDSIPQRDDIQVIVVDDNSDADKVDFAQFPGIGEAHTEVYLTKEGRGAGYARNVGMSHAVGKWIVFADADDFFMPDLTKAMDEYVDSDLEIVYFKTASMERPSRKEGHRGDGHNEFMSLAIEHNEYRYLLCSSPPYWKFISRQFLIDNNIGFNEVRWSNDVMFNARCTRYAKRITASPLVAYCVTSTPDSLITNTSTESRKVRHIQGIKEMQLLHSMMDGFEYFFYWYYNSWYNLYKSNHLLGLYFLPKTISAGKKSFLKQLKKHFILNLYNDSVIVKRFYQFLNRTLTHK